MKKEKKTRTWASNGQNNNLYLGKIIVIPGYKIQFPWRIFQCALKFKDTKQEVAIDINIGCLSSLQK